MAGSLPPADHAAEGLGGSMYPINRILVAVKDPEAKAFPAIAKAAQLAKALDAEIRLFHGLTDPVLVDAAGLQASGVAMLGAERQAHCRERLEAIAKPLRRRGVQVTSAVEWDFPAHEAICRQGAQFEADLIVAEAHPRHHHAPWLLRFADWELLRCSSLPVLLVKSARPYRRPRVLAALDPGHEFAKPANLDGEILHYASTVADALHGSRHANMKELRFDAADGVWRVAFAFDPSRKAVLLACGDKSGGSEKRFYRQLIAKADPRFDAHVARTKQQKEKKKGK